jgi:DNA-binding Xre family transcriptional regulator
VYNEPVIILTLDEVLKEKGKTAYQVAKNTGLHQSVVSKLRRNEAKMIALDVLDRLCDELDCKPSDLIVHQSSKPGANKSARTPETPQTTVSSDGMTVREVRKRLFATTGKMLSRERINNYITNGTLRTTQPGGKGTPHIISEADYLEFETWYKENILKQK